MIRRTLVHARSANSLHAAIALELGGAGFERTVLDLAVDDQRAAVLALHAAGKVPVYVEDSDGERFVLTRSGAIMDHVLREARPELFPVDRRQRAAVHASVCAAISDVAVQNAHYPVVHMRRALLARVGDFGHALAWADRMRALEPWSRAIAYSGLELPAEIAA